MLWQRDSAPSCSAFLSPGATENKHAAMSRRPRRGQDEGEGTSARGFARVQCRLQPVPKAQPWALSHWQLISSSPGAESLIAAPSHLCLEHHLGPVYRRRAEPGWQGPGRFLLQAGSSPSKPVQPDSQRGWKHFWRKGAWGAIEHGSAGYGKLNPKTSRGAGSHGSGPARSWDGAFPLTALPLSPYHKLRPTAMHSIIAPVPRTDMARQAPCPSPLLASPSVLFLPLPSLQSIHKGNS